METSGLSSSAKRRTVLYSETKCSVTHVYLMCSLRSDLLLMRLVEGIGNLTQNKEKGGFPDRLILEHVAE